MIKILHIKILIYITTLVIGTLAGYTIGSYDPGYGPYHHFVRMLARNISPPYLYQSLGINYPFIAASDSDWELWNSLDEIKPDFPMNQTQNFRARLLKSTGFELVQLKSQANDSNFRIGDSGHYLEGKITELFVEYSKPIMSVRLLLAEHTKKSSTNLMIIFPGSWTSSEHIMGLRKEDYHRNIGKYYFEKGMDIAAYDSAHNGTIETWLNTLFKLQGIQAYGVWSRAVCDLMDSSSSKGWANKYENIYLYGLSRAARTAEYIAALCPGFKLVFIADNPSIPLQEYFWNDPEKSNHLKYGVWQDHLTPFISHTSSIDLMYASHSPMIYTLREDEFELYRKDFAISSRIISELKENQNHRYVFKSDIGHKPELELIDEIIKENWDVVPGIALQLK